MASKIRSICYTAIFSVVIFVFYRLVMPCTDLYASKRSVYSTNVSSMLLYNPSRELPLIFIGGMPRSGTTLLRVMLDAHPEVRCGEETRVIPRILGMRSQWTKAEKEAERLKEAGLSDNVLDDAVAAFILEVIVKHGEVAPRLCNKDPFTLKSAVYLAKLFPQSKYVLMVRDGRAVVHSIISRKVTITGFDLSSYRNCLQRWNQAMETMIGQCQQLGSGKCMMVFYEQLVLHPETVLRKLSAFLDLPWHDAVLHHQEYIDKPGGISLSKTERSTDQVIKPVNLEALDSWVSAIPEDVRRDMDSLAPMLAKLGYDPHAYPPVYGQADQWVQQNTQDIKQNEEYWKQRNAEIHANSPRTLPRPNYVAALFANSTKSN